MAHSQSLFGCLLLLSLTCFVPILARSPHHSSTHIIFSFLLLFLFTYPPLSSPPCVVLRFNNCMCVFCCHSSMGRAVIKGKGLVLRVKGWIYYSFSAGSCCYCCCYCCFYFHFLQVCDSGVMYIDVPSTREDSTRHTFKCNAFTFPFRLLSLKYYSLLTVVLKVTYMPFVPLPYTHTLSLCLTLFVFLALFQKRFISV